MNMIKSLILGSAAGLLAVGGAQAADLPVKAKAVEYVKICSLYGAGFYYVPGTDTCLKLGGYLRADVTFNGAGAHGGPAWSGDAGQEDRFQNKFIDRTRMQLDVDTRTATEYGVVRTFGMVDIQISTLGGGSFAPASTNNTLATVPVLDNAGAGTVVPEQLFLQFAGFTFGKSFSAFSTPWGEAIAFNLSSYIFGSHDTSVGVNNIQYTAQFGNGFSATVGLDDPSAFNRTALYNLNAALGATGTSTLGNAYAGVRMPDIVGNVKLDQAWGLLQLSGAVHEVDASYNTITSTGVTNLSDLSGHPSTAYGGSVMAALQIKNIPTGPGDDLKFDATWSKGDTKNVISTSGGPSPSFAMWGNGGAGQAGSLAFGATTDGVYLPVANGGDGNIHLTTAYAVRGGFTHNWDPHWSSSIFATQSWVKYDATATANYCAAYALTVANPGTYTCNPNYALTQVGANVRWTPVANLTFSAEAMYVHFGTGFSGFGTLTAPTAPLPAGVYQFKNQNTAELEVRVQRNF